MAEQATTWFKMQVTPSEKAAIERLAEQRGRTQKEAVLRAVERELANGDEGRPSVYELTKDLCGSIDDPNGPTDLSTNPKHMKGYGKD